MAAKTRTVNLNDLTGSYPCEGSLGNSRSKDGTDCRELFLLSDSTTMADKNIAKYSGHQHFRHRLVLSFLSGKAVLIDGIRSDDKNPGLRGML